jgi:hypothetical protein
VRPDLAGVSGRAALAATNDVGARIEDTWLRVVVPAPLASAAEAALKVSRASDALTLAAGFSVRQACTTAARAVR